ncbi:MAG: sterol carrier family protein [Propionibacteriaceae bacterium]|nr:sterol carrier family protein [Propionibacteriaceae bacterium]
MFRPDPRTLAALEALAERLPGASATRLRSAVQATLDASRPDLTDALLLAARLSPELDRVLCAAACRATAARLASRRPGGTVELRVPPFVAVQLGFGDGPRHTRGTPPNVVEMSGEVLLDLATGRIGWDQATVSASGVHAERVAELFPVTAP